MVKLMKVQKKDKIVNNRSINSKTSKYFYNEVNINNTIDKKNNYIHDSNSNDKINHNIVRQHTKINSSPFSSINMNNNINNHTNYYYANNNSIINVKTNKDKYSHIQSKNYKYKRINNIREMKIKLEFQRLKREVIVDLMIHRKVKKTYMENMGAV